MERKISPFAHPFAPNPLRAADIPNAESIDGSRYPFFPYYEAEPNSHLAMRNAFQNIGFQPQYRMFSQEELRLADYNLRQRYATNPIPRPPGNGIFGHHPPLQAPPTTTAATGGPPPPVPQSGNLFGSILATPAPPSTHQQPATASASQPVSGNTVQAAPPTSVAPVSVTTFAPPTAPSSQNWASTWGQRPNSGLFVQPFSLREASGSSLFGHAQPTPADPSTQNGSSSTDSTPSSASQGNSSSSTPVPTPAAAPAPVQPSSQFNPARTTTDSRASTGSLFGFLRDNPASSVPNHTHQPPSIFGIPPGGSTGGRFGAAPSLFPTRSNASRSQPATPFNDEPETPRPGQFGFTSTIQYPQPGNPLPGIPHGPPLGSQSTEQEAQQEALLHLCLLAETILWPELYNAAIEAYIRGELNLHRPIPPEHVSLIYDRTPPESTLRKYVIESMCTNRGGDSLTYIDLTRQYDELMQDILNQLPKPRSPGPRAPWELSDLVRSFHMPELSPGKGKGKGRGEEDAEVTGLIEAEHED